MASFSIIGHQIPLKEEIGDEREGDFTDNFAV
jgi:hypothetical protein